MQSPRVSSMQGRMGQMKGNNGKNIGFKKNNILHA